MTDHLVFGAHCQTLDVPTPEQYFVRLDLYVASVGPNGSLAIYGAV